MKVKYLAKVVFSSRVYCEAYCGGTKKRDTMSFVSISTIKYTIVLNVINIGTLLWICRMLNFVLIYLLLLL